MYVASPEIRSFLRRPGRGAPAIRPTRARCCQRLCRGSHSLPVVASALACRNSMRAGDGSRVGVIVLMIAHQGHRPAVAWGETDGCGKGLGNLMHHGIGPDEGVAEARDAVE